MAGENDTGSSNSRVPDSSESARKKAAFASYLKYSHVGIAFFAGILIFTFGGLWLDGRAGTSPLFLLLGLALGFAGGLRAIYADVYGRRRRRGSSAKGGSGEDGSGESASDRSERESKP